MEVGRASTQNKGRVSLGLSREDLPGQGSKAESGQAGIGSVRARVPGKGKVTKRAAAVEEVRRFAKERDVLFDRAREHASGMMAAGWNVDALMGSPRAYLRARFSTLGHRVIRDLEAEARRVGSEHAEKLVQIEAR
jgi:hypothetical protein